MGHKDNSEKLSVFNGRILNEKVGLVNIALKLTENFANKHHDANMQHFFQRETT